MTYRAAIFDLDGTLLDTLHDLAESMNRALTAHGYPTHPIDRYRLMVGEGARVLAERASPPAATDDTVRSVHEAFLAEYAEHWNIATRPYDGIVEMLHRLIAYGIDLAVLSDKPDRFTKQCVATLLPGIPFAYVLGERTHVRRKPDPQGALEIANEFGLDPGQVVYLGDTATDMQTAVSAGMLPVGALWGFRSAAELREYGAKHLIDHPLDILDIVHDAS